MQDHLAQKAEKIAEVLRDFRVKMASLRRRQKDILVQTMKKAEAHKISEERKKLGLE